MNQIEFRIKLTPHFDANSRSKIKGDWPCLILIFLDKCRFLLRPLFFAYEDRTQIIRLIAETYRRLAATINAEELAISTKLLWERITLIMTDSVRKNLQIGHGAAEVSQSNRSNIHVLADTDKQINFRNKLQTFNSAEVFSTWINKCCGVCHCFGFKSCQLQEVSKYYQSGLTF